MTDKQIIEKIEEIIAPYQTEIELDCLSLPIAIESILERKEQECEELKHQIEDVDTLCSEKESLIDKCLQTLTEIKEIALSVTGYFPDGEIFARPEIEQILQKISECEVVDEEN